MASQKTECFILRKIPLRETSWILTALTCSFGKLKGVVKGARKAKSIWASSCELMTHANMVFFEKAKTNLHLITELSILDSHEKLRNRFAALAYASYFAELLDQLLEEHDPHSDAFQLLQATVKLLEEPKGSLLVLARAFEIKLLELLGFLPRFADCIHCGSALEPNRLKDRAVSNSIGALSSSELQGRVYFSSRQGGIFCKLCHQRFGGGIEISQGSLQAIRFILRSSLEEASRIKLGNQIQKELAQITKQFIEYRIERSMRALQFISEVAPLISES
ncbi:MAG: DNA repair protein RecO [Candidatus Omnitrophica bacterium]|nr:DNA repair protein RecO [Candidatus Omnitrophota bacterium]